ncbi:hypothetical protein ACVIHI_008425 [Bradyrhizobium sp. USDA 4524]|nr:hypothetical protein [Bradyrhizobium sp. USDA 4538]MCP1899214.1 hypothetical protein [Bradyrhizobium sp. USDA 4537]MCP1986674.1 hypothetical protein [Bradyrhizobium sp. USDA 4539]
MTQQLRILQSFWAMERRRPGEAEWPLEAQLAMIRDAGFDGAGVRFIDPVFMREVTEFLHVHNMIWQTQCYPTDVDDLKPVLELVSRYGADHVNRCGFRRCRPPLRFDLARGEAFWPVGSHVSGKPRGQSGIAARICFSSSAVVVGMWATPWALSKRSGMSTAPRAQAFRADGRVRRKLSPERSKRSSRMRSQRAGRRADRGGVLADAHDGPAGIAAMAGGHVLRHGGVLVIAAHALMRGNPLALVEDLDSAGGEPHLDLGTSEAMRNAVVMLLHLDVVVEVDAPDTPLREHVGLAGNGLSAGRSTSSSNRRRVTPSRRIGRSSLSLVSNSPIAALTSARP